jgi:hypothetical protein
MDEEGSEKVHPIFFVRDLLRLRRTTGQEDSAILRKRSTEYKGLTPVVRRRESLAPFLKQAWGCFVLCTRREVLSNNTSSIALGFNNYGRESSSRNSHQNTGHYDGDGGVT